MVNGSEQSSGNTGRQGRVRSDQVQVEPVFASQPAAISDVADDQLPHVATGAHVLVGDPHDQNGERDRHQWKDDPGQLADSQPPQHQVVDRTDHDDVSDQQQPEQPERYDLEVIGCESGDEAVDRLQTPLDLRLQHGVSGRGESPLGCTGARTRRDRLGLGGTGFGSAFLRGSSGNRLRRVDWGLTKPIPEKRNTGLPIG